MPVARAARRCRTVPEGLEPVPSAFPCEKKNVRESQPAREDLVNTPGADLREGGVALGPVFIAAKLGWPLLWDETDGGGGCCKKAIFGGLSGYRAVLSSTLAACLSKICLCCKSSGRLRCQGGREHVCR